MGYDFKNISELEKIDFSTTFDTLETVTISRDGSEFVIEGTDINVYTKEEALAYIKISPKWAIITPIIKEVNIDFVNKSYTVTVSDSRVLDIGMLDYINDLGLFFEKKYSIKIDTIKASFQLGQKLTFNNIKTVNCSDLAISDIETFNKLSKVFQSIKMILLLNPT